jgi:hypothetical protein
MKKTSSKYDRDLARVITKSFPFWTTFCNQKPKKFSKMENLAF